MRSSGSLFRLTSQASPDPHGCTQSASGPTLHPGGALDTFAEGARRSRPVAERRQSVVKQAALRLPAVLLEEVEQRILEPSWSRTCNSGWAIRHPWSCWHLPKVKLNSFEVDLLVKKLFSVLRPRPPSGVTPSSPELSTHRSVMSNLSRFSSNFMVIESSLSILRAFFPTRSRYSVLTMFQIPTTASPATVYEYGCSGSFSVGTSMRSRASGVDVMRLSVWGVASSR